MNYISKFRHLRLTTFFSGILFVISCFNRVTLIGWIVLICLWVLISRNISNAIRAFIMIQLRTLLNPGLAATFSGIASLFKWLVIFILSFYILFWKTDKYKAELSRVYARFIVFASLLILTAVGISSYPTVAVFKAFSYIVPFLAIFKGICCTNYRCWMEEVIKPLGILVIGSVILISSPIGYLRNGHAFQGFFNHPNVYGVVLSLFLAGYLYLCSEFSFKEVLVSLIIVLLVISTESRTGMVSCLCALLLFLLSKEVRNKTTSSIVIVLIITGILALFFFNNSFRLELHSLLYKGGQSSIIYSRNRQFIANILRFKQSPLLGTGFNVPYDSGITSYRFSFDLVVENGNLVLALLGDCGILGTAAFIICYSYLFFLGNNTKKGAFIVPFIVSMGEQSFFSTNNFGIIIYLFIAIFCADGLRIKYSTLLDYDNTISKDNNE